MRKGNDENLHQSSEGYSPHLIFVKELPNQKGGKYANYEHRRIPREEWEYCDIRIYIGQRQEGWLDQVDHWHTLLSESILRYTPWWWFMPASRMIAWYPPILNPLFFAMSAIEYCETSHVNEFYLVKCPEEVRSYIKELKPEFRVSIGPDRGSESKTCKAASLWKKHMRGAFKMARPHIRYLRHMGRLLGLTLQCLWRNQKIKVIEPCKLLVCSYILAKNVSAGRKDHFFGDMFDDIRNLRKQDILWLYFPGLEKKGKLDHHLRSLGFRFVFLQDLFARPDIIKIWRLCIHITHALRMAKNGIPELQIGRYKSSFLARKFFNEHIRKTLPIDELVTYLAMKRFLKNSNPLAIVYPYEEKGLERALIRACQEKNPPVRTIGFAHAVYNQNFLYLRRKPAGSVSPLRPDILASTGPAAIDWLIRWAHLRPDRIQAIGSPRYAEAHLTVQREEERRDRLRVLVLIGKGYELIILANYLEEVENLFDHCEVLIREYPHGWYEEQKEGIARLRKGLQSLRVEEGPLDDQICWCDVAIFCSTSAGIEVMLKGRMAIYCELHNFIVLDPLYGKVDLSQVERCATPQELRETLNRIRKMSDEEYALSVRKQREIAVQIYAPMDKKVIAQLVLSECDGKCL